MLAVYGNDNSTGPESIYLKKKYPMESKST